VPEEPEPAPEGPPLEELEPVPDGDELGGVGLESRSALVEPEVLPKRLGLLLEASLPDFPREEPETPVFELGDVPVRPLAPIEEPETPVSELCDEVPERLLERGDEVELLEPVPDIPLESDIPEELTPSCCAVSESTLPVAFRLFDF
jgi:hypothetical protein